MSSHPCGGGGAPHPRRAVFDGLNCYRVKLDGNMKNGDYTVGILLYRDSLYRNLYGMPMP